MRIVPLLWIAVCSTATLVAGPARPVLSGLFSQTAPVPNGPPPDPPAQFGQWFISVTNGAESPRKWELHDDDDSLCIQGQVTAIQWGVGMTGGFTNIAGFTVLATVVNSLTPATLLAGSASNSHWEIQNPPQPRYWGTMAKTRLAAEFAVAEAGNTGPPFVGVAPNPPGMSPPYYYDPGGGRQYVIEAQNEDLAAWYCFQGFYTNLANPPGAYYVPAWEFGDIPPGMAAQKVMQFQIKAYGGGLAELPQTDLRHSVIRHSFTTGSDVFYNRSDSLKVSHWIDQLLVDIGSVITWFPDPGNPEPPVEYIYASDVSVFFNAATGPTVLQITPQFTQQTLSAIQLDWLAQDVGPFWVQYCDNLASNVWTALPLPLPLPPTIPGPMQWRDDGTLITPPLSSPRFYRLYLP